MSEPDKGFEAEGTCAPFYGVNCAEDNVNRFAVVSAIIHRLQAVLQRFQKFFAFNEERGSDLGHWIVVIGHDATPIRQPFATL